MRSGVRCYRRGNRWYIQWWREGRRVTQSLGPTITTEAQAMKVFQDLERAGLEERLARLDPSRLTLAHFLPQYLEERRGHLKPGSLARYDVALRMLMADLGGNTLLRSITARRLQQWAGQRLAAGVSRAGVNADLRHVRGALNWAAEAGMLQRAPRVKLLREPRDLPRHLTPAQAEALLAAEVDPDRRRLWIFLLWTGLRRSEALSLRWEHVTHGERPAALVAKGKGDRQRMVPLLPKAYDALGPARDVGPVWAMDLHPRGARKATSVVPKADTVTHWFKEAALAAGLDCRLHDLRHTAITWMVSRGVLPRVAQEIAGHANYSTTERYAKAVVTDLYDAAARGLD